MDEAAHGQAGYKMYMYSGHDSTIMPLLVALGKEVESWPTYMSNLVFENWRTPEGQRYVKVSRFVCVCVCALVGWGGWIRGAACHAAAMPVAR